MRLLLTLCLFIGLNAFAQLGAIHRDRLPPSSEVTAAFDDLLQMQEMVSSWNQKWTFPESKDSVKTRLSKDISVLKTANEQYPHDTELMMLLGLAAHFAYNLDVANSFELSVNSFNAAMVEAPKDYRPEFLLGIHLCSTLEATDGMKHLLHVEQTFSDLPNEFWRNELLCSVITNMPSHAVYAADRARLSGQKAPMDEEAHRRLKATSIDQQYTAHDAWMAVDKDGKVTFISRLCGMAFSVDSTMPAQIPDIEHGACTAMFSTPHYPGKMQTHSSATYMVLAQVQKNGDTMDEFKRRILKNKKNVTSVVSTTFGCPVKECEVFEVRDKDMYEEQGGAHILAVFFTSTQPKYPGLKLEAPSAMPAPKEKKGMSFFRPEEIASRLPGTQFFVLVMDASENIYDRAEPGFAAFLKSFVIDTD